MGKVVVAPPSEIHKESVRINVNGEEIDPKTKRVISKKEKEYVPTPEELAAAQRKSKKKEPDTPDSPGGLDAIIAKKLGEKIGDAIGKALESIDMDKLIGNAIDRALKKK